jgi:hypothetical protein
MCEFTVYLEKDGKKEKITKNVVKAKLKDGVVTLMDSAGQLTKVEKAGIVTVDTLMQELILKNEA